MSRILINQRNWSEIQSDYNKGMSTFDLIKKYSISSNLISKANKLGLFKSRSMLEGFKLKLSQSPPRKHSQETKDKLSKIRKEYLLLNPDKVPYLLNHKHKRKFYSEEYFAECFKNTNFIREYKIGLYSLDFADLERKIDIEVDGEQHFVDSRIIEHDKKRNEYLLSLGWNIIRIRWSLFQKLCLQDKQKLIQSIINNDYLESPILIKINSTIQISQPVKLLAEQLKYKDIKNKISICDICHTPKSKLSKFCNKCRKSIQANYETFSKPFVHWLLWNFPKETIYKQYIGRKTLTRLIKLYSINYPKKGFFLSNREIDFQI